jgi:hypothetical protein
VKRSLNRQFKVKDLVHGGYKTLSFADHGGFYANVDVRDPVTGVSVYSYNQKRHTVTNDKGHGVVEKDKLLQRKVRKVNQLKEQSREHSQELETFHGEIAFFEEKYRSGKFPLIFARDKIQANLAKIAEVSRHKDLVDARLALEEREVKALETDLERSGIAEDLPLPRAVLLATPTPVLEGMRATKDALDDAGRAVGLVSEKGWKPGHGMAGGSIFDTLMEEFAGQRAQGFGDGETYFGQPLLDPVSGKANDKVVRRKNSDTKLRAHEYNKSVTDVMMARSDGTSRYERPSPQQRVEERAARREQQAVVDALVKTALEGGHAEGPLEAWAESENRKCAPARSTPPLPPRALCPRVRARRAAAVGGSRAAPRAQEIDVWELGASASHARDDDAAGRRWHVPDHEDAHGGATAAAGRGEAACKGDFVEVLLWEGGWRWEAQGVLRARGVGHRADRQLDLRGRRRALRAGQGVHAEPDLLRTRDQAG